MSRSTGGSRYPSAFGHTPSYRSYVGSSPTTAGSSALMMDSMPSSLSSSRPLDIDIGLSSTRSPALGTSNVSSSTMTSSHKSYSSSSTSTGAGAPKVEFSSDSSYLSTATDNSGIPHTSRAYSSSSYSSQDPYKNRTFNYSYNI